MVVAVIALCYDAISYPETGMVSIFPSVEKIKRATSWKPKVSFREGIESIMLN